MIESLKNLDSELHKRGSKLYIFQGMPDKVIENIISETKAEAIFINRDYTPFSMKRDLQIRQVCINKGLHLEASEDILLIPLKDLASGVREYKKFTFFHKKIG